MGDVVENITPWAHKQMVNGALVLVEWQPEAHYAAANVPLTKADHAAVGSGLAALVTAAKTGAVPFAQAMAAEFGAPFWSVVAPCAAGLRADLIRQAG